LDKELSPAEKRALEAEKRAMWRAARYNGQHFRSILLSGLIHSSVTLISKELSTCGVLISSFSQGF